MTSQDALAISVQNGQAGKNVGAFEDRDGQVPGSPPNVTFNQVRLSLASATAAEDASDYWTNGWFQARGLPYELGPSSLQLWALSTTLPGVGSVKVLVTVSDVDKTTNIWGLLTDGS